jgi:site-specific recombinase XerD
MDYLDSPPLLSDFLNYIETIQGKSERTVKEYYLDLRVFYRFCGIRFKLTDVKIFDEIDISSLPEHFLKEIKIRDLHAFVSFIDKMRGNNNKTKARKIASLRAFFKYLVHVVNEIEKNPAENLETPKIESRHPVHLTLEDAKKLLNSVGGTFRIRDYAIITLFLNCGIRLSELVSIDIDKIKQNTLTVIGKGDKERTVYLNDSCQEAIHSYLEVRPEPLNEDDKALFLSSRRQRISPKAIQHMLKKHLTNAGLLDQHYSPHKLRHTAATLMYQYGNVDIRALQEILGHESVSTTQIYTHINSERLKKAVESNPLGKETIANKEKSPSEIKTTKNKKK